MEIETQDKLKLDLIAQIIYDKKGENIIALDVRNFSFLTEYFVIAEGNVERHVAAIARALADEKNQLKLTLYHIEGLREGNWVVLDFGHIMVHLLQGELREKYDLEKIWSRGTIVDLNIKTGPVKE